MILRLLLIFVYLVISSLSVISGNDLIDSLLNRLPQTNKEEKSATYLLLSEAYRFDKFSKCINYGDSAIAFAYDLQNEELRAKSLKSVGVSCYFNGEFDLAIEYYNQGLEAYRNANDLSGVARCLNNIGLVYEELGNYELSTDYYERSGDIAEKIGDRVWLAGIMMNLGNSKYYRGDLRQALNYYYRGLLIYTELDDKNGIGNSYNNIGSIYDDWGEHEKSLDYFNQAREIYIAIEDEYNLSKILSNMAEIYNFQHKDYIKAQQLYEQSLELKIKANDLIGIALLNNNLGTLYANMEEFAKALKYFNLSENLYGEMNSETGLVMVYYNIGKLYEVKSNPSEALKYYKLSLEIADKIGQSEYITDNYEALFKCYAAVGDHSNFKKYYKLYEMGNDTLIENLHQAEVAEMEARFKADQAVRESIEMAEKMEESESEVVKYRLLTYGFAGIIVLSLLIYFLYFIFRR